MAYSRFQMYLWFRWKFENTISQLDVRSPYISTVDPNVSDRDVELIVIPFQAGINPFQTQCNDDIHIFSSKVN